MTSPSFFAFFHGSRVRVREGKVQAESFHVKVNGVSFYCEKRGEGPSLVLVPDGSNDCGPFEKVAALLAGEFTVLSFDMRGAVRSPVPGAQKPVTPKMLAADIVGILRETGLGPAAIYGCSAGGQAALAVGKYFPEAARNLVIHEAALQADTPLRGTGFDHFRGIFAYGDLCRGVTPFELVMVCDREKWLALGAACLERIARNSRYWRRYYVGTVDMERYTEGDFAGMPPVDFSVGAWSPAWMAYANIDTAGRAGKTPTWLPCAHFPHVTCPEVLAAQIRKACRPHCCSRF